MTSAIFSFLNVPQNPLSLLAILLLFVVLVRQYHLYQKNKKTPYDLHLEDQRVLKELFVEAPILDLETFKLSQEIYLHRSTGVSIGLFKSHRKFNWDLEDCVDLHFPEYHFSNSLVTRLFELMQERQQILDLLEEFPGLPEGVLLNAIRYLCHNYQVSLETQMESVEVGELNESEKLVQEALENETSYPKELLLECSPVFLQDKILSNVGYDKEALNLMLQRLGGRGPKTRHKLGEIPPDPNNPKLQAVPITPPDQKVTDGVVGGLCSLRNKESCAPSQSIIHLGNEVIVHPLRVSEVDEIASSDPLVSMGVPTLEPDCPLCQDKKTNPPCLCDLDE